MNSVVARNELESRRQSVEFTTFSTAGFRQKIRDHSRDSALIRDKIADTTKSLHLRFRKMRERPCEDEFEIESMADNGTGSVHERVLNMRTFRHGRR